MVVHVVQIVRYLVVHTVTDRPVDGISAVESSTNQYNTVQHSII